MPGSAMRRKARSSVSKLVECGLDLNQPGRQRCQSSGKGNGTSGVFQNYSGLKYDIEFQHTVHNCWLLLIVSGNSWPSHWNAVHLGLVCPVSIQSQSRVQHLWWTAPPLTDLRHPKPTPWGSKSTNGHWWLSLRTRFIISNLRNRNGIYIYIYIYIIYTWKTIKTKFSVRTGLDIFFVRCVLFPNTAMSGCKPSTYRLI